MRKILIVDDSPEDRMIYQRKLKKDLDYSYSFSEAETGEEGLELFFAEHPDCVLLDYNLPDLNGLEFLSRVLAHKSSSPVIMLTGQGNESVAVEAMKNGADDYLVKAELTAELLSRAISSSIDKRNLTKLLEEKQRELEDFACMAAHDLKSPLIVISGMAELLQGESKDSLGPKGNGFIERILRSCSRMTNLVDSLLDYARAGRADEAFELVDLSSVLQDVVSVLGIRIQQSGARVEIGALPTVSGDKIGLLQLFQNIVSNGIKFCKGSDSIIVVSSQEEKDCWRVTVKDNGIGIASENLDKIFLPLTKLHRKDEFDGAGIGLAICKKVIDQHGWTLKLESEPGCGSSFHFFVPKVPTA